MAAKKKPKAKAVKLIPLTELMISKMSDAVRMSGTFNPDECLHYIEESLTVDEYEVLKSFLGWVHKNDLKFGSANVRRMWHTWEMENFKVEGKGDFIVSVTRTSTSTRDFLVRGAKSAIQASDFARGCAGDHVFSEQNAEYSVEGVIQLEKPSEKTNIPVITVPNG